MDGLKKPTAPGRKFNMDGLKTKEVDMFVKKARAKGAPGNDGVSYKVYRYCPKLRIGLFLLLKEMWKKKMLLTEGQSQKESTSKRKRIRKGLGSSDRYLC